MSWLNNPLMELEAENEEGDLLGLQYMVTPWGVCPLVQKLPFNMQVMAVEPNYKLRHNVSLPPFYIMINFINNQAHQEPFQTFQPPSLT